VTKTIMTFAGLLAIAAGANAGMTITEYMYKGNGGEFIEFTNLSGAPIDMTGWSYDDDSQTPGEFDLSGFGTVAPGQSVIITEDDEATFRSDWNLPASVLVIGGYDNKLGRNDEINLFDAADNLVDRLTYGDEDFAGTIRTVGRSGNPLVSAEGQNNIFGWVLSDIDDSYGSYVSGNADLGNPGFYIPTPGTIALIGLAGVGAARRRR
jgi:predicted extracellular nuclease